MLGDSLGELTSEEVIGFRGVNSMTQHLLFEALIGQLLEYNCKFLLVPHQLSHKTGTGWQLRRLGSTITNILVTWSSTRLRIEAVTGRIDLGIGRDDTQTLLESDETEKTCLATKNTRSHAIRCI